MIESAERFQSYKRHLGHRHLSFSRSDLAHAGLRSQKPHHAFLRTAAQLLQEDHRRRNQHQFIHIHVPRHGPLSFSLDYELRFQLWYVHVTRPAPLFGCSSCLTYCPLVSVNFGCGLLGFQVAPVVLPMTTATTATATATTTLLSHIQTTR